MVQLKLEPERSVGAQYPTYIIAEIGQNHQGSVEMAKLMIDAALVRFYRVLVE